MQIIEDLLNQVIPSINFHRFGDPIVVHVPKFLVQTPSCTEVVRAAVVTQALIRVEVARPVLAVVTRS